MINKDNGWETYVQQPKKSLNRERNSLTRERQADIQNLSAQGKKPLIALHAIFLLFYKKPVRMLKIVLSYSYSSLLSTAMLYPGMSQVANRTPTAPPYLDFPHINQMTFLLT